MIWDVILDAPDDGRARSAALLAHECGETSLIGLPCRRGSVPSGENACFRVRPDIRQRAPISGSWHCCTFRQCCCNTLQTVA